MLSIMVVETLKLGQQFPTSGNNNSQQSLTSSSSESPIPSQCDLFIKNLDDNISNSDIVNYFRRFGHIINARVMRDPNTNNSKGFAFVSYTSAEEADRAKSFMDGKILGSKQIIVRYHEPKNLREIKSTFISENRVPSTDEFMQKGLSLPRNYSIQQSFTSSSPIVRSSDLFVKNLDVNISSSHFFNHFRQFGRIISARVMRDQDTNNSKGFGFVSYTSAEEADRAKSSMHNKMLGTKQIIVRFYEPKKLREAALANQYNCNPTSISVYSTNEFRQDLSLPRNYSSQQPLTLPSPIIRSSDLFVKNLDVNISSSDLFNHFRRFGRIISARVMRDQVTYNSKGFGFVSYTSAEEADRAKSSMHNKMLGTKQIIVRFYEPKKLREAALANQFNGNSTSANRLGQGSFFPPGNYGSQQSFAYTSPEGPIMGLYNLLIKNLDTNIYSSDLFNHFRQFGNITCARVMRDPQTNNSKGFGYVSYTSAEDAGIAKLSMHGKILGTKQIVVRFCEPKNHVTELDNKFNGSPNPSSEDHSLPRHNS
ncbi:4157_t:CDS:2, partial [Racocetra fulgida]